MTILYIKATVVSICVGNAWKILPIIARSLWSFVHYGSYVVVPTCERHLQFPYTRFEFCHESSIALEISKFLFSTTTLHDNNLSIVYVNLF
jgi:hypothetical protein